MAELPRPCGCGGTAAAAAPIKWLFGLKICAILPATAALRRRQQPCSGGVLAMVVVALWQNCRGLVAVEALQWRLCSGGTAAGAARRRRPCGGVGLVAELQRWRHCGGGTVVAYCSGVTAAAALWQRPFDGSTLAAAPIKWLFGLEQVQTCLNAF